MKEAAEADGNADFVEPEMPEEIREDIKFKDYISKEKKYVVCLDTLGQDRELTKDQQRFVLNACSKYQSIWAEFEKEKVKQDIELRVASNEADKLWAEENKEAQIEEEAKIVEEKMIEVEDVKDDDHQKLFKTSLSLEYQANFMKDNEEMVRRFEELKKIKTLKYGKLYQAILYLLGYDWDKVTESGTQKFHWKTAK